MRSNVLIALVLVAATAPPAGATWTHDPIENLRITSEDLYGQNTPRATTDGAGGSLVVWSDTRTAPPGGGVYVQRVLADGTFDPAWPENGRRVLSSGSLPRILKDGAGGAFVLANGNLVRVLADGALDPAWPVDGIATGGSVMVSDGGSGVLVAFGGADIRVRHVLGNGTFDPAWPAGGTLLCGAAGSQWEPGIVSDGAGGAVVAWNDGRIAGSDIYAARVLASGAADPAWPADGRALCTAAGIQINAVVASDGAGGAIVAWQDERTAFTAPDLYVMRVLADGTLAPGWTADGKLIINQQGAQENPVILADGAGGAFIAYIDSRGGHRRVFVNRVQSTSVTTGNRAATSQSLSTNTAQDAPQLALDGGTGVFVTFQDNTADAAMNVYAQHLLANTTLDPAWPPTGLPVGSNWGAQLIPMIVSDATGGAIVAWQDDRIYGNRRVYAQRFDRYGYLGSPEPEMTGVADVPGDQGGFVTVSWNASYLEAPPYDVVTSYQVFRSPYPGTPVWTEVATLAADDAPVHAVEAATPVTATPEDAATFAFRIVASSASGATWTSQVLTGSSTDDLAPAAPAAFDGEFADGSATLTWDANAEADLDGYRLHRGATPDFVPSEANRIAEPESNGWVDVTEAPAVYKLTAVDVHGNESPVATLDLSSSVRVEPSAIPRELALEAPRPNPAQAQLALRYAVPGATHVSLVIYDAAGRRVRELARGEREPGVVTARWDLRDDDGRAVEAGLYFVRLVAGRETRVRRVAVTR